MSSSEWSRLGWMEKLRFRVFAAWWLFRFGILENEPRQGCISLLARRELVERLQTALGLMALKAPHAYQLVQQNLRGVVEGPYAGLFLREDRGWLVVEAASYRDPIELATYVAGAAFSVKHLRANAAGSKVGEEQWGAAASDFMVSVRCELEAEAPPAAPSQTRS